MRDYLQKVTCNRCGKMYEVQNDFIKDEQNLNQFQQIHWLFRFGSKFDGLHCRFDVCENCIEEWINEFKIKPEIKPEWF